MSFCRITGRSKALPKPNYFPLLPPISPADANRFCRITGKAYGLPSHHYIPVLLTTLAHHDRCRITNVADELGPHHYYLDGTYGKRKHVVLTDYRYIFPVFDTKNDDVKILNELMSTKTSVAEGNYVYRVEERKCHLVFPAALEAAVRDGDVRDVMMAKNRDTVLLKINKGKSLSIDLQQYEDDYEQLFEGEGPTEKVLHEREQEKLKSKKRRKNLTGMMKIFEDKSCDENNNEIDIRSKRSKITAESARNSNSEQFVVDQNQTDKINAILSESYESYDLIKPLIESWDWNRYGTEIENINSNEIISKILPTCYKIDPVAIEQKEMIVNIEEQFLEGTKGFDLILCISKFTKFNEKPNAELIKKVFEQKFEKINEENLEKIQMNEIDLLNLYPNEVEILEIIRNLSKGSLCMIADILGVKLRLSEGRDVFVPGQMVTVENVEKFVPGQMVNGKYIAGIKTDHSFIPGYVIGDKTFVAGQECNGEFYPGQTILTNNHHGVEVVKFIEGQTVVTKDGIKFIAGIVNGKTNQFVPGQYYQIDDKFEFVPGQSVTAPDGENKFIPGQNIIAENGELIFMPGQTTNGKFIPGKSIVTEEGSKFVPGQEVNGIFVPGITKMIDNEMKFVPGINIETKQGTKFVEGQIIRTKNGEIFHPGHTTVDANSNILEFKVSKSVDDVIFHEPQIIEYVIDSGSQDVMGTTLSIFGHMVQTSDGVEFYPNKVKLEDLPKGKIVPGKLIKQDMETKFVPGMMTEDGFIPGQLVWTGDKEQFVPGQVIETSEGLKFVPGQVIETKSGNKFVPGQTIQTEDGPRFVPGQIIQTKSGPTFIPGQIMYTEEEGERFVPGQVVDTEYGPRFVPGCVIENNDKVTFVPGQVVETSEGLKFIAPDLSPNADGDEEFSIQSFLVTPEELKLLKPHNNWTTINGNNGELSIDAKMLRQLSAAGMSIGQQVEASAIDFVLQSTKNKQIINQFTKLHFPQISESNNNNNDNGNTNSEVIENKIEFIFNEMKNIIDEQKMGNTKSTSSQTRMNPMSKIKSKKCVIDPVTMQQIQLISSIIQETIDDPSNTSSTYEKIIKAFNETLESISLADISSITEILTSNIYKTEILNKITQNKIENKFKLFRKNFIDNKLILNNSEVDWINEISEILTINNDYDMLQNFHEVIEKTPKILYKIINHIKENDFSLINDNYDLISFIKNSIVESTREIIKNELVLRLNDDDDYRRDIVQQSIGLAKILNLNNNLINKLYDILLNKINLDNIFANGVKQTAECNGNEILDNGDNANLIELLCRVDLMNKFAENNVELQINLSKLKNNEIMFINELKNNSKLSELVRKSGQLLIKTEIDENNNNESSANLSVPLSLFMSNNLIAMEEYLIRSGEKSKGAFLILKNGLQMVVPRELSHDVITGKCSFTVLDDNGIRHFEPLHVFKILNLSNRGLLYHRFSMYSCDVINN